MGRDDYDAALRRSISALQIVRRHDAFQTVGQLVVTATALAALGRDAAAAELLGGGR